jgi:hypothetical protein
MAEPSPVETPAPGLFARAVGMIFSPRATFERFITHAPKFIGVVLLSGFAIGMAQGLPQLTDAGRQAALDMQVQQIERFTGQPVTDQMYAQMEQRARFGAYMSMLFTPVGVLVATVIFAGLYYVAFNVILGGTASFKQVMSVTAHANVIAALGALVAAPVMYLQGTVSTMGPFTLGAVLPMLDEASFLARFLGFLGVFQIWGAIVTAIGFSVLYRRKAGNIAIGLLVFTALIAAIFATVAGLFSGR